MTERESGKVTEALRQLKPEERAAAIVLAIAELDVSWDAVDAGLQQHYEGLDSTAHGSEDKDGSEA